ncbi:MAG: acetyl-CoA acetyltransferase [Chloroflexi bacterium RBG_16_57_8]|nr:MAG: acetyl-CoA acetyltransferase [Chloroflexi bacterium RBG_16_57_8]
MREVFIVSGARTAVGNFGGTLQNTPVVQLGALVIKEALKKAGLRPQISDELASVGPDSFKGAGATELEKRHSKWDDSLRPVSVDEVIMGNVLQGGQGQNTARQATIYAGMPKETNAFTVNKVCASGLKAIALGAESIALGEAEVVIAGGMENMSMAPYILPKARWGYRMDVNARGEMLDLMVYDGLWEIFYGYHMGNTAENISKKYGISRQEQDEVGLLSHQRARAAIKAGLFKEETVPVVIPQRRGDPIVFDTDERPMDTSLEKMAGLAPAFSKEGTCTAGNASGINDAAAAVVLMSKEMADKLGLKPFVSIVSFASGGVDPAYMGLGPVPAVRKALKRANLTVNDMDTIELNEAFAAQTVACNRELGFTWDKTNTLGGGISIGHPIGCTGARLMVTIMHDMKRRNLRRGLVTMCIGGGQGMAMVVERK